MNLQEILEYTKLLESFFSQMGIFLKLKDETLNILEHSENAEIDKVNLVLPDHYMNLGKFFGEALTLKIKFGGILLYDQSGEFNSADFEAFQKKLSSGDYTGNVNVELKINKLLLAKKIFGEYNKIMATIIFQEEVLSNVFSNSIIVLDNHMSSEADYKDAIFVNDSCRQVIVVPRLDVFVMGDRLAVVGGKGIEQIEKILEPPQFDSSLLGQIRNYSEQNIKWIRLGPLRLTPFHFDVKVDTNITDPVQNRGFLDRLIWLQFNLSLMYMSDSTAYNKNMSNNEETLKIIFKGASGSSQLDLPLYFLEGNPVIDSLQGNAAVWLSTCRWVFENDRDIYDRMAIVQNVVTQTFPGSDGFSRLKQMLLGAKSFFDLLNEHWKAFSEGKIEKYFDKVKQIGEFVETTARSYNEAIDSLIKSLITTMLGEVATVMGSFLGGLFKDPFDPKFLIIGLIIYSLYMAIFPGFILLTNTRSNFNEMKKRMDSQFMELQKQILGLEDTKWESWKEQLESSHSRFENWFNVTIWSYVVIFELSMAAVVILLKLYVI